MQIGKLEHQIKLQSLAETNNSGSLSSEWVDIATVWADIRSQRGDEAFQAARENATETIRIMMRYRADLQATWRIEWAGQQYNILHVDRTGRRRGEMWLTAQVVGAI